MKKMYVFVMLIAICCFMISCSDNEVTRSSIEEIDSFGALNFRIDSLNKVYYSKVCCSTRVDDEFKELDDLIWDMSVADATGATIGATCGAVVGGAVGSVIPGGVL